MQQIFPEIGEQILVLVPDLRSLPSGFCSIIFHFFFYFCFLSFFSSLNIFFLAISRKNKFSKNLPPAFVTLAHGLLYSRSVPKTEHKAFEFQKGQRILQVLRMYSNYSQKLIRKGCSRNEDGCEGNMCYGINDRRTVCREHEKIKSSGLHVWQKDRQSGR